MSADNLIAILESPGPNGPEWRVGMAFMSPVHTADYLHSCLKRSAVFSSEDDAAREADRQEADYPIVEYGICDFVSKVPFAEMKGSQVDLGSTDASAEDDGVSNDAEVAVLIAINEIDERIFGFETLGNGWHNGDGVAPSSRVVENARNITRAIAVNYRCPVPRAYPTVEGEIQLEWDSVGSPIAIECRIGESFLKAVDDRLERPATIEIPLTDLGSTEQLMSVSGSLWTWLQGRVS